MKKAYSITVQGNSHKWVFNVSSNPSHVEDWRRDGLVVDEVVNTVPTWLPSNLTRLWCAVQDLFYLRPLWK